MSKTFPIIILTLATFVGVVGGVGSGAVLKRVVSVSEEERLPPVTASQANTPRGRNKPVAAATAPKGPDDKTYLKTILCRDLFDRSKVGECDLREKGSEVEEAEPKTDLNVTLLGTLVAEPKVYSSALIQEDGEERAIGYSIDDKIGDATIVSIEKKLVRLRRGDGREEILRMDEEGLQPADREPTSEPETGEEVKKVSEDEFEISSAVLDKHLNDLEGLSKMARALLHRGPDGNFDGYRLSAIRRNTIADQLGIKNGDIVHSVNGKPLNSMQSAMEAYNTMQNEKAFTFEVTRRGEKKTMNYSVK